MRLVAYRVGAAAWVFTGVVHDILEFALSGDADVEAAMQASTIEMGPISLQQALLARGVSLAMGAAMIVVGVLLWMIGDLLRDAPESLSRFVTAALAGSVAVLALSVAYVPGPPLVTFTVATAAFSVALVRARRAMRADRSSAGEFTSR